MSQIPIEISGKFDFPYFLNSENSGSNMQLQCIWIVSGPWKPLGRFNNILKI